MEYLTISFFIGIGLGYFLNELKWRKPVNKKIPKWVQAGKDLYLVTNTSINDLMMYASKTTMPIVLGGVPKKIRTKIFKLRKN